MPERTAHERETLIFKTPEQAREWREQVGERLEQARQPGVDRRREQLGEEISKEFAVHGEAAGGLRTPWEHTHAEHEEVQALVDTAFAKDLPAALRVAAKSAHYPRNLDLFHDVLTGEMYKLLIEHKLNKQPVGAITIMGAVILIVVIAICLFFWFY